MTWHRVIGTAALGVALLPTLAAAQDATSPGQRHREPQEHGATDAAQAGA